MFLSDEGPGSQPASQHRSEARPSRIRPLSLLQVGERACRDWRLPNLSEQKYIYTTKFTQRDPI